MKLLYLGTLKGYNKILKGFNKIFMAIIFTYGLTLIFEFSFSLDYPDLVIRGQSRGSFGIARGAI